MVVVVDSVRSAEMLMMMLGESEDSYLYLYILKHFHPVLDTLCSERYFTYDAIEKHSW
jgi:hypothetical protein